MRPGQHRFSGQKYREMLQQFKSLEGHCLYVEERAGSLETDVRPAAIHSCSNHYRELRRVVLTNEACILMPGDEFGPLKIPFDGLIAFRWFEPFPANPDEWWPLVMTRRMKPMQVVRVEHEKVRLIDMYLAPPWIRSRPPLPISAPVRWHWGEPWCKNCEPTFFWSPEAKPSQYLYMSHEVRCLKCFSPLG